MEPDEGQLEPISDARENTGAELIASDFPTFTVAGDAAPITLDAVNAHGDD